MYDVNNCIFLEYLANFELVSFTRKKIRNLLSELVTHFFKSDTVGKCLYKPSAGNLAQRTEYMKIEN